MQAVILASGFARRMGGVPKGLVRVGGREIFYRTIHLLHEQGIRQFLIVVNPENREAYRKFLEENLESIDWKLIVNEHPEKENGYSLHLAAPHVDGPFVLTMADHVYSRKFIRRAFEGYDGTPSAVVDRNPRYVDLEEATRVKCTGGRVERVSKGLTDYDAVDTGLFFLDREVFRITESYLDRDAFTLSQVIEAYHPACLEVNGEAWMDVDTPQEVRRATWMLIKDATKGRGDGWVSRIINRPISRIITYLTIDHLTPNQASLISFALGILSSAIALISPPAGAILYQIHSILDGVDGEIARVRLMESRVGGWMDSILDRVVDFSFLTALALFIKPSISFLPWILLAIFSSLMVSYTSERFKGAFCKDPYRLIPQLSWIPGKRDERIFIIMLLVLAGWLEGVFIVIALLSSVKVIWNFFWMLHWAREE